MHSKMLATQRSDAAIIVAPDESMSGDSERDTGRYALRSHDVEPRWLAACESAFGFPVAVTVSRMRLNLQQDKMDGERRMVLTLALQ